MIDLTDFQTACNEFETQDSAREEVIKGVRSFQRNGKSAISAAHAAKMASHIKFKEAEKLLTKSQNESEVLVKSLFTEDQLRLRWERSFAGALEEFVEAKIYVELKKCGVDKIDITEQNDEMKVSEKFTGKFTYPEIKTLLGETLGKHLLPEIYLGAMADVTGELGRWSVNVAMEMREQSETVARLRNILAFMQSVSDEFVNLGFLKKQQAVEQNVQKVRNLLLQCTLSKPRVDCREVNPPPLKQLKLDQ
jgi:predicted translin family RNA/ssDNA-binding protein